MKNKKSTSTFQPRSLKQLRGAGAGPVSVDFFVPCVIFQQHTFVGTISTSTKIRMKRTLYRHTTASQTGYFEPSSLLCMPHTCSFTPLFLETERPNSEHSLTHSPSTSTRTYLSALNYLPSIDITKRCVTERYIRRFQ